MLRLIHSIVFTQVPTASEPSRNKTFYFPAIETVEINETFDTLTNTATITLPRNLKYQDRNIYEGDNPILRRGDKVKISAGYAPKIDIRFDGYISKIDNNVPVVIKCEDSMWLLKQKIVKSKTFSDTSLPDVMDYIMEGTGIDFNCTRVSGFDLRINEASIGLILKKLRDELGIYSWFKDGQLYVGLAYYPDLAKETTIIFEESIIESELQYLKKEDVKIKVNGVLINQDNTREEISVGDSDGDLRTVFQYGGTLDNLRNTINVFLEQANYTGYYGSFTTFLQPKITHGDYVVLSSYKYPERKGKYLVKSVDVSFGVNGGRQTVELERRIE